MPAMVLLLHELPDGSSHFDWMLQPAEEHLRTSSIQTPLITFRLTHRIDLDHRPEFIAERLPDHRERYLHYEGPIHAPGADSAALLAPPPSPDSSMGHRGRVHRVAAGSCTIEHFTPDSITIHATFTDLPPRTYQGCPLRSASSLRPSALPGFPGTPPFESLVNPWIFRLYSPP